MAEIVILDGVRTPFVKAGTAAKGLTAQELGRQVLVSLFRKVPVPPAEVDEVILGCVAQPIDATNVARVAAINAGLPLSIPAYTVQRNCSSSMQAVSNAIQMIESGRAEVVVAGGTESLSNAPLIYNPEFTEFFNRLSKAKTLPQRLAVFASFRLGMLNPRIGILEGLTDPTCGMIMGQTAELLARELGITRIQQDDFALASHRKAATAVSRGRFGREIAPLYAPPGFEAIEADNGIRDEATARPLGDLHPVFDRHHGTVTAGNSSQITDGAAALIITTRDRAAAWGIKPLARIVGDAYAGLEPRRMGLGPVVSTAKLLARTGRRMSDFGVVEINEAFAAQVLACLRFFDSDRLSSDRLGLPKAPGPVNPAMLNVNGGAIALGHPVGSTGARLLLTLAHELKERNVESGLATLCVGGGQGAAFALERTAWTQ
ncbi:MAG: thiolase family protein [Candidatus Coatesbacteria bacterium]